MTLRLSEELLALLDAATEYGSGMSAYWYDDKTPSAEEMQEREDGLQDAAVEFLQARGWRCEPVLP